MLLAQQLATSHHTRLPVYEHDLDNILGFVHVKQVLQLQQSGTIDAEHLRGILRPAYFIPAGTPLLQQLRLKRRSNALESVCLRARG